MNILFVCALPLEQKLCKKYVGEALKNLPIKKEGFTYQFLLSGVGNYQTLATLQNYLFSHQVDFIINIWVCGIHPNIKNIPTPLVQAYRIKNLANLRESIVPLYLEVSPLISLASSEKIITSSEELLWENFVDMESYAIDFVATKEKIPYMILKLPLDRVGEESKYIDTKEIENLFWEVSFSSILTQVEDFLIKNNREENNVPESYFSLFPMTFSEREIFKKQYFRYEALKLDIDEFIAQNKELPKKEFFKKLQENN